MKKALIWLAKQGRFPDNWLLLIAVANWLHMWNLAHGNCRGVVSPWYCDWTWYGSANRLLFSALCVRSRRTWLGVIGFLISVQLVAAQLFCFVNIDEFSQILISAREFEKSFLWHLLEAMIEHPLTQGFIAALIAPYAMYHSVHRLFGRRPSPVIVYTIKTILLILFFGYLSSFISHGAAERSTARWLYRDILRSSSIYGDFTKSDYFKESAGRFASVGANVIKVESNKYLEVEPWGEVGPSGHTGPFLISVRYLVIISNSHKSGHCLVFNFFGFVKILDKDSSLYMKFLPYLQPY